MNVREALAEGTRLIATYQPDTPYLDACLLLAQAMGTQRSRLLAMLPDPVPATALEEFRAGVRRRSLGESVAYILGWREFYGHRFAVDRRVLAPRPETELLVDTILAHLPAPRPAGDTRGPVRYHDGFTGSGCIGISVALQRPDVDVSLSDVSADALAVCRANALSLTGRPLESGQGRILTAAKGVFDAISANPPYVDRGLTDAIVAAGSLEPRLALDGGETGLDLYPALAGQAFGLLAPGGCLAVEIGDEQGAAVCEIFARAGFSAIQVLDDLAGQDRVVLGVKCGPTADS
ncbi:MAG: peptide chain release factor N(5)-glutamine methyltransferase [Clostridia bacterium]